MSRNQIIMIVLLIVIILIFINNKSEHVESTPPATPPATTPSVPNLSAEAIQNIAKIYADSNNIAIFNNIRATGKITGDFSGNVAGVVPAFGLTIGAVVGECIFENCRTSAAVNGWRYTAGAIRNLISNNYWVINGTGTYWNNTNGGGANTYYKNIFEGICTAPVMVAVDYCVYNLYNYAVAACTGAGAPWTNLVGTGVPSVVYNLPAAGSGGYVQAEMTGVLNTLQAFKNALRLAGIINGSN
jgi:hypothetical protein